MTFRTRTALVVIVVTTITMGAAFALVWERFTGLQRERLDQALLEVAHAEALDTAAGNLTFTDAPGPFTASAGPLPKFGVIYDADGNAIATTPDWRAATAPRLGSRLPGESGFDFDHEGKPFRGVVVGVPGGRMRVLVATSRHDLDDDAHMLGRAMVVALVLGCGWSAVVAFAVATRLTREHSIVADVARRVAEGDTSARVTFASSNRELRELAGDINTMIGRLVGLNAAQDKFIAHAAHELRTPLTSLRIELEHAIRTAGTPADYEAAMVGALESARRLSTLAEDLLELARVKATSDRTRTALADVIADALADVAPLGRARDVSVVTDGASVDVQGDRRGLARLLRNVLENALRFSPRSAQVRMSTGVEQTMVDVIIDDDGPGVRAEDVEAIFEPFVRANPAAEGGTGLGLPIARELARSYGGEIRVVPGKGGRFVVTLRRA